MRVGVEKDAKSVTRGSFDFALPILAGAALVGFALGTGYFACLRFTVRAHVAGTGRGAAVALTCARLIGAVLVFTIAARVGAGALLGAFAGFLVARTIAVRRKWRLP